uniref:Protein with signal anchor n=1 Tax=Nyssomyia neivai TaxID=330878 RepID=A0A1L8DUR3_9DIPT
MRLSCQVNHPRFNSLHIRLVSGSSVAQQKDESKAPATTVTSTAADIPGDAKKPQVSMSQAYKPDNFERRLLVWAKKYKSIEDVPNYVSREEMEKSRSKARIRISNYMIVATLVGCIIMGKFLPLVYSGKQAAERGDTVSKINRDWHASFKEQKRGEDHAALAKAYNTK